MPRERVHRLAENIVDANELVSRFNNIIDLDCFVDRENLIGLIKHLHLLAGQAIARHTVIAVRRVNLQIIVESLILAGIALLTKLQ